MVIQVAGGFGQSLVSATGVSLGDGEHSFRIVMFLGNMVSVSGFGFQKCSFVGNFYFRSRGNHG